MNFMIPTLTRLSRIGLASILSVAVLGGLPISVTRADAGSAPALRDGEHDFDFNVGTWRTHITRIVDPLEGGTHSFEMNGTVTVRPLWHGRAQLEEIEADGPKGHWEGMTLFLYNPAAHQWNQIFTDSASGMMTSPLIGELRDGRIVLYSADTLAGRAILVRGVWSNILPDAHRYEESYSADGGATWKPAFRGELTRLAPGGTGETAPASTEVVSHDFDFDLGLWKTHSRRLMHPLSGSHPQSDASQWSEMNGVTTVRPVWGGKANIAEFEADGPKGHLELLALRLYDPKARQWNVNFATSQVGILNAAGDTSGVPSIGSFRNGRIAFYDQEPFNGRAIWVRFEIYPLSPTTARSEQAFSDDNGQTWETNWINEYTLVTRTP